MARSYIQALITGLVINVQFGVAQIEYSNWHFGNKAALTFTSGVVSGQAISSLISNEACASISDHTGKLLFYSNGIDVWTSNHQLMANGSGLNGHVSTTQGALIVRQPGSSTIYHLFTLGTAGTGQLAFSTVDMSLASGTGSVVVKNQLLATDMTEKMTAAINCNGQDVWVLAHKYHSNEFLGFSVTAGGVNTVAVVSAVGASHAPGPGQFDWNYAGAMKISPTGRKLGLVISSYTPLVELFDFDSFSGIVSNPFTLDTLYSGYGVEFSPDGTKFYCNHFLTLGQAKIFQWDITAGTSSAIIASKQLVANPSSNEHLTLGALQLGPDGRLYVGTGPLGGNGDTLAAIISPNLLGTTCNFTSHAVSLGTGTCLGGLPAFINTAFRQRAILNKQKLNSCASYSFSYTPYNYFAGINYSVQSVQWSFDDPGSVTNTTTLSGPQHVFTSNGKYAVKLVTHYQCFVDTITDTVTITDYPSLAIQGKTSICKDDQLQLTATGAAGYSWSTGHQTNSVAFTPGTGTVISVTGTGTNTCKTTLSVTVTVSGCQGLDGAAAGSFAVFPNPGSGLFTIDCESPATLLLFDLLGVEKRTFRVTQKRQEVDLGDMPSGVYMLRRAGPGSAGQMLIKL